MITRFSDKISLILILIVFAMAYSVKAEIELPLSPINAPLMLNQGDEFDTDSDKNDQIENPGVGEKTKRSVSKTKAVLLSLLIPGAGQMYADAKGRGEIFMGAEVTIWVGYLAFNSYGNWKEDDYVRFATRYAAIDPSGKDEEFFRNLTFYDDREQYNDAGRIIDPSSPYYPPNSGYDWYWESEGRRDEYRSIRNASETAFRKATFMIGMAVFNRILAGIDAFRLAQNRSNEIKEDSFFGGEKFDVDLKGSPFGNNPRVGLEITRRFK